MSERKYERLSEDPLSEGNEKILGQNPTWSKVWRGINFVMAVFLFLAASVQFDDPDPYVWVPAYGIPGALTLIVTFYPLVTLSGWWRHLVVVHLTLCLAASLYLVVVLADLLSKGGINNPLIHEEGRELGGLIIISVWLLVCRFTRLGNPKPTKDTLSALLLVTGILAFVPLAVWGLCFVEELTNRLGHCKDMFNGGTFSQITKMYKRE